ncbi:guanine nucleotide exchange factor, putative [Entamoeba invadens IP1]|uniref:Guanine nucleotide exchange factor, putative n=1 Tax=Entamoeba invadens IP1 TaxID=370355 RepID=A0A0A1U395_ENTIV|nr:guanine nucleotide exchange factor, putative [Entamoeba invadens IP1]ELP87218.1 guanine nucleotide exchange factor, putative [Entamoeba invadens IP1]|eukprot:XP_004253989.1 guanine nucleotide exchange factor, putative [Entamoeba invadens IP1]
MSLISPLSRVVRARIVSIMSFFSSTIFPLLTQTDFENVMQVYQSFLELLKNYGLKKQALQLKYKEKEIVTFSQSVSFEIDLMPLEYLISDCPIDFLTLPPVIFAKQVTLLQSEVFKSVNVFELFLWNQKNSKSQCSNLALCVTFFNELQNYFATLILKTRSVQTRAKHIKHIILIANEFLQLQNFDGLICILTLLSSSAISRLSKSFEMVDQKTKIIFTSLQQFASPENNWEFYRVTLDRASHSPCTPYIGLFLSDLLFTEGGFVTQFEDQKINFVKCQKMSEVAEKVMVLKQRNYQFQKIEKVEVFIRRCLKQETIPEQQRFEISKTLEQPKGREKFFVANADDDSKDKTVLEIVKEGTTVKYVMNQEMTLHDFYMEAMHTTEDNISNEVFGSIKRGVVSVLKKDKKISELHDELVIMWRPTTIVCFQFNDALYDLFLDPSKHMSDIIEVLKKALGIEDRVMCFVRNEERILRVLDQKCETLDKLNEKEVVLLLPFSKFSTCVDDSLLCSSYFDRYELTCEGEPLTFVHVEPFVIFRRKSRTIVAPKENIQVIFDSTEKALLIVLESTEYTKENPLRAKGDLPILQRIVTEYHTPWGLCGIDLDKLPVNAFGVSPLFFKICNFLYLHFNFKNENFFTNQNLRKAQENLIQIEFGEEIDLSQKTSPEIVGMLFLFLSSLTRPLFGYLVGDLAYMKNIIFSDENIEVIAKKLLKSVEKTPSQNVIQLLLLLFNEWYQYNPNKLQYLMHFGPFFCDGISPTAQGFLLKYLIINYHKFLFKNETFSTKQSMTDKRTKQLISIDQIVRSVFTHFNFPSLKAIHVSLRKSNGTNAFLAQRKSDHSKDLRPRTTLATECTRAVHSETPSNNSPVINNTLEPPQKSLSLKLTIPSAYGRPKTQLSSTPKQRGCSLTNSWFVKKQDF